MQPTPPIDLDAYCARIGYDGPRTPTLATLSALHACHPAAIPFEAIDVLLDRGIDLRPEAVDAKLIAARRGGYCFEQNNLLLRALAAMGFAVEGLIARVSWMVPPGAPPLPRTHMALRVTIDGEAWLADVGFGGCVLTAPLRFAMAAPQPTLHGPFRLAPVDDGYRLEAALDGHWTTLYDLATEPQQAVDYEPPNWFTATHPDSVFRHSLKIARSTPEARYSLLDARLTIRTPGGAVERRSLTAAELEDALRDLFGLPVEPDWRPLLAEAAARTAASEP